MDLSAIAPWIIIPIQIFFLDLMLGADNAVVIAIACRSLRPEDVRKAVLIGTGGAIILRFALTLVAGFLLNLPFLKLTGALVLIIIAINLVEQKNLHAPVAPGEAPASPEHGSLAAAALQIIVVDAAMSLDNVVAIAAIARGNLWLLAAGVLFSIPVLMFGSLLLANLVQRFPAIVVFGGALLGWIAGEMAIGDPIIAPWAHAQAPTLVLIAPALGAAFVVAQARLAALYRSRAGRLTFDWLGRMGAALPTAIAGAIIALVVYLDRPL